VQTLTGINKKVHSEIGSTARVCVPQPTKLQRIGDKIKAATIPAVAVREIRIFW
jgi:hypothetical protein